MTKEEELWLRNQRILKIRLKRKRRRMIKRMVRLTTFAFMMIFCLMCVKIIFSFLENNEKIPELIFSSTGEKDSSIDVYKEKDTL